MQWMCEKKEDCCRGGSKRRFNKKNLIGICCILTGLLVLICFAPEWFVAVIVSFLLIAVGALLIGFR